MKHASSASLGLIAGFLDELRALPDLRERKLGVFYRKSRAFLHFHEHGDELFADVRLAEPDFDRLPSTTAADQRALLAAIKTSLE